MTRAPRGRHTQPMRGPEPTPTAGTRRPGRLARPARRSRSRSRASWCSAALVLAIEPLRTGFADAVSGDTESLREDLRGLGVGGALIVLALALVHSVVWYPTEILNAAAGYVYGFWVGAAAADGRLAPERDRRVLDRAPRGASRCCGAGWAGSDWTAYERIVSRGGVTLLLGMRLVPIVPFSFFSYAAGLGTGPVFTFMWTTARRLPAPDGRLRLPRQPPRGALARRPVAVARRRGDHRPAAPHPPPRAVAGLGRPGLADLLHRRLDLLAGGRALSRRSPPGPVTITAGSA